MKWFIVLVLFVHTCIEQELEIIYESSSYYTVYSYDHPCGSDVYYPEDVSVEDIEEPAMEEPEDDVFIPWKLW
jgi:hypothetical protein